MNTEIDIYDIDYIHLQELNVDKTIDILLLVVSYIISLRSQLKERINTEPRAFIA